MRQRKDMGQEEEERRRRFSMGVCYVAFGVLILAGLVFLLYSGMGGMTARYFPYP